jgi:hypothetical protein
MDIAVETICYVISKARELVTDLHEIDDEPGHHAADDVVKEDLPEDDPPSFTMTAEHDELREFIETLNEDEQAELVAIAWLGRGTFTPDDWDEAVDTAREEHGKNAPNYLIGQPLLAEDLESGLEELGLSCEDED